MKRDIGNSNGSAVIGGISVAVNSTAYFVLRRFTSLV
jgi:hypothetical protein